jgi:hypothetical protein
MSPLLLDAWAYWFRRGVLGLSGHRPLLCRLGLHVWFESPRLFRSLGIDGDDWFYLRWTCRCCDRLKVRRLV